MYLSDYEFKNIVQFLNENTTYDVELLLKGKSDVQINAMYIRIKSAMSEYPKEIFDYLNSHPAVQPRYSLDELKTMKYNELSALKKQFKIKKSRRKVTKQEDAPAKTMQRAKETLKKETTSRLAATMIAHGLDEKHERDLEILTEAEIFSMYGESLSTLQLAKLGIVSEEVPYDAPKPEDDERMDMIDSILDIGVSIGGKALSFTELIMMSDEELKFLATLISTTLKNRGELKRLIK